MSVLSVSLKDFRNYDRLELELSSGFNVLAGPNAQGKTNFLEALHLVGSTRLLRGMRDAEAVREGAGSATVDVTLAPHETALTVVLSPGVRKRALLNHLALPRASDLLGRLPVVSITSEDLSIVRGDPSDRRLWLDLELSTRSPAYLRHLSIYKRSLEQRNALLRAAQEQSVSEDLFDAYEQPLAENGSALREARRRFLEELQPYVASAAGQMGEGERVDLSLAVKDAHSSPQEALLALSRGRGAEIARGTTLFGPHRDDLSILIDGREGRLYGSQGQQRTAVISLKLGAMSEHAASLGEPPLLLLDDMLSDLDARRRERLIDLVLERAGQAVLTCTEPEAAGTKILENARLFHVRQGQIAIASSS